MLDKIIKGNIVKYISVSVALLFFSVLTVIYPASIQAQGAAPQLLSPADGAVDIEVTEIEFTWSADEDYSFYLLQISQDSSFSPVAVNVEAYEVSYVYEGTLEHNKKYYWRVQGWGAVDPSDWAEASFTTVSSGDAADETPAASDNTTVVTASPGSSFMDNIIGYLSEIGWPLVGGMAFVLVVLIVLISMLLTKPKKGAPAKAGAMPPRGGMGQQIRCTSCGAPNTADRKFCANCGNNLMLTQQFQPGQSQVGAGAIVCQSCGSPIAPGKQFCGSCGNRVVSQQPAWQPPQFQQPTTCTVCGSPLQPGQQFCGSCGNKLASGPQWGTTTYQTETFMCPICGASINKGTNPCPGCNTWLDW